jgi:diacylglycerol kinase (ATP)
VLTGVAQVLKTRTWSAAITIDADATERSLYFMLVSNTRLYGGVAQITHHAIADDGELDVALMRRGGIINVVRDGARVLLKRHDRSPNVRMTRAHTVEISTPNIPIQLDGEDAGTTPLRIEVAPGALTVIVPRTLRSSLFTREYSP